MAEGSKNGVIKESPEFDVEVIFTLSLSISIEPLVSL